MWSRSPLQISASTFHDGWRIGPICNPSRRKKQEEGLVLRYKYSSYAQYAALFWTRGIHQLLAQSMIAYNTISMDELLAMWLLTTQLAVEHTTELAIEYTETKWADIREHLDMKDPEMRPVQTLLRRDEAEISRILGFLGKDHHKKSTSTGAPVNTLPRGSDKDKEALDKIRAEIKKGIAGMDVKSLNRPACNELQAKLTSRFKELQKTEPRARRPKVKKKEG